METRICVLRSWLISSHMNKVLTLSWSKQAVKIREIIQNLVVGIIISLI